MGLDPLYVANEGRFVLFLPPSQIDFAVSVLHRHSVAKDVAEIGEVTALTSGKDPQVLVRTLIGTHRILDLLSGEQLPRIC